MLEVGARFANDMYLKTSLDPSDGTCVVTIETIVEGEKVVATGSVTWDEDDGGLG